MSTRLRRWRWLLFSRDERNVLALAMLHRSETGVYYMIVKAEDTVIPKRLLEEGL